MSIKEEVLSLARGMGMDLCGVANIERFAESPPELRPGFTLGINGVLHPLKSQCAMFFVGRPQPGARVRLDEIPCSSCKGSKCLYRQFGGCHLPINRQPQPRTAGIIEPSGPEGAGFRRPDG